MEIGAAIAGRRSTREYLSRVPDKALIESLIEVATLAPSAVNQQPWTFTVVRDQALLDHVSPEAKTQMLAAMANDVATGGHAGRFRAILGNPTFHIFYHAPALIVISGQAPGPWIAEDCALAAENLMLMAHSLGLGSCWIGFAQRYLCTPEGKRSLGMPEAWAPVAPIIIGYPSAPPAPVARKAPEIRWMD